MLDDEERLLNLVGVALVVVLVVSVAALALSSLAADRPSGAPDANWTLTRVNDSYVRVTHAGGEPVETADVSVAVDGRVRHPAWSAAVLTDGEHGVVRADDDSTVILLWEGSRGDRSVLARWDLGGSDSR